MNWFILVCYIIFAYGMTLIFTQGVGPKNIFWRMRQWANNVGDNFGLLLRCPLCFSTNLGWVFSLFNWFCLPIALSPFNIILNGTNLWWLAMIMDACLTGAICKVIYNIDDYVDKITPRFEDDEYYSDEYYNDKGE